MKRSLLLMVSLAVVVYGLPLLAQHGHGMSGGHSMAGSMGGSSMGNGGHGFGHADPSGSRTNSHLGAQSPTARLAANTKLSDNLQKLLPSGTTPQEACSGFKNLGQCVAAIHVSHNLNIPFDDLKDKMLGTAATGTTAATSPMSLGKAIQTLAPKANAKSETQKAASEANDDLKTTS